MINIFRVNVLNVINGWWNYYFKTDKVEKIAKRRMKVCNKCRYKVVKEGKLKCGICGCPLEKKVRSMRKSNRCPKGLWK